MTSTVADLRRWALERLARREHSAEEMRQKLCNQGVDRGRAGEVIEDLVAQGVLSDDRYTEAYVRVRRMRGYGPVRIQAELRQRGVGETLIARYTRSQDAQWFETAAAARQKKFGSRLPRDVRERARQMRFLQYRGFSSEQIQAALEAVSEAPG